MKRSTRINLLAALLYAVTLVLGMFLGYKFLKDQGYILNRKLSYNDPVTDRRDEILNIIDRNYVDGVNADSLQNLPIDSLLHQLDPHSAYLPALKAFEFSENLDGNFEGIGIQYYILNDTLLVTGVVKEGPAQLSGLRLGDKILRIDSLFVSGRSLPRSQMTGKIKGKAGTQVQLVVKRQNLPQPLTLNIKRSRVELTSIDAGYMLNDETGYIRISKFGANTDEDFTDAVRALKAKGMKKMVLDLRDNGGGYLSAATGLANQLFPENKLIVYTEGKHEPRTDYISMGGGEFEQGKLAVLINEYTASASEIIAGAVQDQDRGIIIGRRSFGKGLVQEQFAFGDGSALNLTIARYYTPLGRSIQKSYKKGYRAYQHEIDDRLEGGELTATTTQKKDTLNKLVFTTAGGRKVYAGGGIQPDIYIRLDTTGYTRLYTTLIEKKIIFDFVFEVLANRYQPTYLEQNAETFSISETDLKDLVKYAQKKNITVNPAQFAISKSLLSKDLRVLLYKYFLGDAGYYKAQNVNDPMIKQALVSLQ